MVPTYWFLPGIIATLSVDDIFLVGKENRTVTVTPVRSPQRDQQKMSTQGNTMCIGHADGPGASVSTLICYPLSLF